MTGAGSAIREEGEALLQEYLARRRRDRGAAEVTRLSGDASTRRYFRVREGDERFVLALYPEAFVPERSTFLETRDLLAAYGLLVPAVVDVDGARGVLLLEDLGDQTLQEVLGEASASRREELYRQAVEDLVTLQRRAGEEPREAECFRVAFDVEKLTWELHYFLKHFVEGYRRRELTTEDRATLAQAFQALGEEIASWPRVLCHRDYHSRNLMLHRDRLYWIDFQDARMGPTTYDLASLLHDAYVDVAEEVRDELTERFWERAASGETREVFRRRFELVSVQRTLKALGTFGYMTTVRESPVYERYVPRTLAYARRLLHSRPTLERLRRTLAAHLEELA